MLNRLTVSNLAIVEKAEVEFAPGLNVLTGETGSGKSVLMGALELLLGGRSDASVVRDGAKEAEVEAEFDDLVIRRTVTPAGRTRAWINDESVSVAELRDLGRRLIDVHGPRANQALLEEDFQRMMLDGLGGMGRDSGGVLGRYRTCYGELASCRRQIEELRSAVSGNVKDELDMLRYQVDELEGAGLCDEDESLAERHAAAAHAEEIVEDANSVTEAIGGDQGAVEALIRLQPKFKSLGRHLPEAESWAAQTEDVTLKLQELSRSIADVVSRIDVQEEDLASLDARLTIVNRLKRKYGETQVSGLMAVLERKRARLAEIEHADEKLAELGQMAAAAEKRVVSAGAELTNSRRAAAAGLSKRVSKELRDLGFLKAKFFVALEPIPPEEHGCDRVVYMFEPNPGEVARPLSSIASSGETARVMLALKCVEKSSGCDTARPTLVFDEIDANIGGEVGCIVGEKMRTVARGRQVIAITHLPQCAVCGDHHLVVSKSVSGGRTRTHVKSVSGDERVTEIARMLGGAEATPIVKEHARELLNRKG